MAEAQPTPRRRPHWLPAVLRGAAAGAFLAVVVETVRIVCLGRGRADLFLMTFSPSSPLAPLPAGLDRKLAGKLAQRLAH